MGYARTALLLAALTALFGGVGFLIGGVAGMVIALIVAVAMNLFAYWNSDRMVLSMYGAKPVTESQAPDLFRITRTLAGRADLPMPKLYVIANDQPNAFATGRNPDNAAVAVTTGLVRLMPSEEVAGVIAHELAHIKNRDTLIMTITATVAGAISLLANFGLFFGGSRDNPMGFIGVLAMAILAPIAATMVQLAISRSREYEADRIGAEISGHPLWLAGALERLEGYSRRIDNGAAERNPATAHLFIVNPLHAHSVDSLFATHPATQDRVARLRQMAGQPAAATSGPWG